MTRIVNVITHRAVSVRKLRKRTAEILHLALNVPAEVAEIAPSEMRRVARVRNPDGTQASFTAYDGRFFEPAIDVEDRRPICGEKIDDYFAGRTHRHGLAGFSTVVLPSDSRGQSTLANRLPTEVGDDVREIVSDNSEERALEVRRQMAGFVLINGVLWRQMVEPAWIIVTAGRSRFAPSLRAGFPKDNAWNLVFRLDRPMDADRYVRGLSKHLRARYEGAVPSSDLAEAPLQRDDRLQAALALGQRVVELLPQGWLRLMPRDAILQWSELRDTIKTVEAGVTVNADTLAGCAGRLLEALDALTLNRHGDDDRAAARKRLFDVLSRWTSCEGGSLAVPSLDETDDEALSSLVGAP